MSVERAVIEGVAPAEGLNIDRLLHAVGGAGLISAVVVEAGDDLSDRQPAMRYDSPHPEVDGTREYINRAAEHPLLSKEQDLELGRQIQEGRLARAIPECVRHPDLTAVIEKADQAANELVSSNLRMVLSIAKLYQSGAPFDDLTQAGNEELVVRARQFDPSYNVKFSDYAYNHIKHAILSHLYEHKGVLPPYLHERVPSIRRIEDDLRVKLGRDPTDEEVFAQSKDTVLTLKAVERIRAFQQNVSLGLDWNRGYNRLDIEGALVDPRTPEDAFSFAEIVQAFAQVVQHAATDKRRRQDFKDHVLPIVRGILEDRPRKEIAKALVVTPKTVWNVMEGIRKQLQAHLTSLGYDPALLRSKAETTDRNESNAVDEMAADEL